LQSFPEPVEALGDNKVRKSFWIRALLISLGWIVSGCGQPIAATPSDPSTPADNSAAPSSETGVAGFGIQCPYGYVEEPTATQVSLVTVDANGNYAPCPNAQLELTKALEPIILSADCRGKNLIARTSDRTVDNTFEAMPDGSFYLEMPAGTAVLNNGCSIPLVADMSGIMSCGSLTANNYDQVDISLDAIWKTAPTPVASPGAAAPARPAAGCVLPAGCMLHSSIVVHQCKQ
jgi:hypothetical protein